MTRLTGSALRVTVLIGEHDTWRHRPLYWRSSTVPARPV